MNWKQSALAMMVSAAVMSCSSLPPLPMIYPTVVETLPMSIAREQRAGKVTIVEFMDFSCPACRRQHIELSRVLDGYGDRVRLVRKHRPLEVDTGARGYECAQAQGMGDSMADALYKADSLDVRTVAGAAYSLGLDMHTFQRCTMSRETSWRVQRDMDASEEVSIERLPTLFINNERYDGVASERQLRAAIDRMLPAQ